MNTLFTISLLLLVPIFIFLMKKRRSSKRLPPGSLGLPFIGQSLSLLRSLRANTAEKWLEQKVKKYGPISKLSLFGKPTVFICGQAANKLVFASDSSTICNKQVMSIRMILGDRNILELSGQDHKRVRDALMMFLKPESLKHYVGKIDEEVMQHLQIHWHGKQEVTVLPLIKILTFNIICSLLFGLERGTRRDQYLKRFPEMIEGVWSVPINLPFTRYNRSLKASKWVKNMLKDLVREKQVELKKKGASRCQDLITSLLSIHDENNEQVMSEKEIIDNTMFVMVAGHETSSALITFLIRLLANNPAVYAGVLQEQEEIAKSKSTGESLTAEDIAKMKYTWRVALETLRMFPPVFGGFRNTLKDLEYNGYLIPKGWQIFWVTSMTHNDDAIFPEPSKFDPSRFEKQASIPPYCFIPFGGGARICPGYEFARIETLVTIHYLVTQYTWKLCSKNFFRRDPTLVPTKGLPIQIVPRKVM